MTGGNSSDAVIKASRLLKSQGVKVVEIVLGSTPEGEMRRVWKVMEMALGEAGERYRSRVTEELQTPRKATNTQLKALFETEDEASIITEGENPCNLLLFM